MKGVLFTHNQDKFHTVDEISTHTGDQAAVEKMGFPGRSVQENAKLVGLSANKDMLIVIWNVRGKFTQRLPWKMNYASLLYRFNHLKLQRLNLTNKKEISYQDNAKVHMCLVTMAKFNA